MFAIFLNHFQFAAAFKCSFETYQFTSEVLYDCELNEIDVASDMTNGTNHPILGKSNESVESLRLCCFIMRTVPVFVSNYPDLKVLTIELTGLKHISRDDFKSLKKLRLLNLNFNELEGIPSDDFDDLEQLEELRLKFNFIRILHRDIFQNLKHLKRLQLSGNKLIILHKELFRNNQNLEEILFSRNQLNLLPRNLFVDLVKLRDLDLWKNLCVNSTFNYTNDEDMTSALIECERNYESLMTSVRVKEKPGKDIFDNFVFKVFFGDWKF